VICTQSLIRLAALRCGIFLIAITTLVLEFGLITTFLAGGQTPDRFETTSNPDYHKEYGIPIKGKEK